MRYIEIALLAPALALAAPGCATKEYVQEVATQTQARVDERLGDQSKRVDAQARRVDDQATRLGAQAKQLEEASGRVAKIETSVDEFGNIARTATSRADDAFTRSEEVDKRVSRLWASRYQRKLAETIHVQFGLDRADLSDAAQTALAALIKELVDNPALEVDLEGYTDSLGTREHNLQLSERRVAAVRRFLVQRGVALSRINWIGMGEVADAGGKADRAKNRRVTVRLLLPADELTAQQTGAKPSASGTGARPAEAVGGEASGEPSPPTEAAEKESKE